MDREWELDATLRRFLPSGSVRSAVTCRADGRRGVVPRRVAGIRRATARADLDLCDGDGRGGGDGASRSNGDGRTDLILTLSWVTTAVWWWWGGGGRCGLGTVAGKPGWMG